MLQVWFNTTHSEMHKGLFTPSDSVIVTVANVTLTGKKRHIDWQNGYANHSLPVKKIKSAARQCYGDGDGVVPCEQTFRDLQTSHLFIIIKANSGKSLMPFLFVRNKLTLFWWFFCYSIRALKCRKLITQDANLLRWCIYLLWSFFTFVLPVGFHQGAFTKCWLHFQSKIRKKTLRSRSTVLLWNM